MIKFLILIVSMWTPCDFFSHNILDGLTPNDFFLNRTYHSAHLKRDQSKFDNDLCKEQLNYFKMELDEEEPWALESEIN